ncbi:MAG: response regulator [Vampirovibrio sp.]|nr:response regulator [Vampirovibrio sp.]
MLNLEWTMKVLVLDDIKTDLMMLYIQMIQTGIEMSITQCDDADEALRLLQQESFDLVVSDYFLNYTDATQVIETTRQMGNKVPFIVVSSRAEELLPQKLLDIGAIAVLQKPVSSRSLLAAITGISNNPIFIHSGTNLLEPRP